MENSFVEQLRNKTIEQRRTITNIFINDLVNLFKTKAKEQAAVGISKLEIYSGQIPFYDTLSNRPNNMGTSERSQYLDDIIENIKEQLADCNFTSEQLQVREGSTYLTGSSYGARLTCISIKASWL